MASDIRMDPLVWETVRELLCSENLNRRDRRRYPRESFLAPVFVHDAKTKEPLSSAMATNLTQSGIALVHRDRVDSGEYILSIRRHGRRPTALRSRLEWTASHEEGWYTSGWAFLSITRV